MHGSLSWSPDGHTIALRSNRRDPAHFDIYLLDLETGASRLVLEQDGLSYAGAFSPDGSKLIVGRSLGPDESRLSLLDIETGDLRQLTADSPPARYSSARWSADGKSLYLLTDLNRDRMTLTRLDVASGELTYLRESPWDLEKLDVSANGQHLAMVRNVDGYSELVLLDLEAGGVVEPSPALPAGVILGLDWTPDGSRLAITVSSARSPGTIHVYDRASRELTAVTRPALAGISAEELVVPRLVRYPSFDGRSISGFFYPPSGGASSRAAGASTTSGAAPPPCLVYAHGGPTSQARPSFNIIAQYFATHGCAVFRPNVRGSRGYGRTFLNLDNVERREDSVADLERGVAWLVREGLIDSTRVAIYGSSYGGYMTLAALTLYPERFAAGVDRVGIANFVSFLERTGSYRRRHRESEYGSLQDDQEILEGLSPLHRVDRIQAPLMVIHGANDPRVPIWEAEQIVEALRSRGRPVEYLRFDNEGHGISRLENRITAYGAMADFLATHLDLEIEPFAAPPASSTGEPPPPAEKVK
jgi:dipeptidyl aminopeptidase/acylaminoacyl peptidase